MAAESMSILPSLQSRPQSRVSTGDVPLGSSVIPIVNKLHDIFSQLGGQSMIELPQVAVVGSQSSGKSSVLEALVGRDFLPRGNDICTRRPLVLQLLQTKRDADGSVEEWGEFLHLPGKRFDDFSQIRREIQAETNKKAGNNKGVSDEQINLKIYSPNVLDITLVDLPGITKVPVGDQPSDIEARIRTMIMSYIKQPSCLILAVTPANSDLANSDALQIAGTADSDGYRTIGVITKLDIMDRGTDASNLLLGKVIPLRLGYVGVVNRSQEDIMFNKSIKAALVAEEEFFCSHTVYNGLASHCGISQLAKKLNQILVQHIKALLPGLKSRISSALDYVANEHASYGENIESKASQGALLLRIISKYSEAFSSMVEGQNEEMSTTELSGGARIHYIFQSIFVKSLEGVDPCEGLTDDDIRTAIQNASGPTSALFVPEVPFKVLVRRQIARFLDPCLQCARFIYDELVKISHSCLLDERQRFPVLRKCMDEVIGKFLRDGLEPSKTMIKHIIEIETDYINTSHPNFIGGSKAVEAALQQIKSLKVPLPISRQKDGVDPDKQSRAIFGKQGNGIVNDQVGCSATDVEKATSSGSGSSWGISSLLGSYYTASKDKATSKLHSGRVQIIDAMAQSLSRIHLRQPPTLLRPLESQSELETVEIVVTKLLLRSYHDIVRKNVGDFVPKTIMHFLVNDSVRELHNVLIKNIYRENLFEELLWEPEEITMKRKRTQETLRVLEQAFLALDDLPLEAQMVEKEYNSCSDPTGLSKIHGLPKSSMNSTSNDSNESYLISIKELKSWKSSHLGELQSHFSATADSKGSEGPYLPIDR